MITWIYQKGEFVVVELRNLASKYIENENTKEAKVALELAYISEHGALQFIHNGKSWEKNNFRYYSIEENARNVLSEHGFSEKYFV